MSAAALYEAALAFLELDLRATVNQEQPDLLEAGSVTAARATKTRIARRDKPHAATLEIVLSRRREEPEGIDTDRVHLDFDVRCLLRKKDQSEGGELARLAEDVARALVRRYRRIADMPVPVLGATFRYVDAFVLRVDDDLRSGELVRSVSA